MAKGKERSAAELRRDVQEREKRKEGLEREIEELERLIRQDVEAGADPARHRERLKVRRAELADQEQDLGIVREALARQEAREQAAAAAAEEEALRVDALALEDEGAALAKALQEDLLRHQEALRPLQVRYYDLAARWEDADKGTFLGAHGVGRAAAAIGQALRILTEGGGR